MLTPDPEQAVQPPPEISFFWKFHPLTWFFGYNHLLQDGDGETVRTQRLKDLDGTAHRVGAVLANAERLIEHQDDKVKRVGKDLQNRKLWLAPILPATALLAMSVFSIIYGYFLGAPTTGVLLYDTLIYDTWFSVLALLLVSMVKIAITTTMSAGLTNPRFKGVKARDYAGHAAVVPSLPMEQGFFFWWCVFTLITIAPTGMTLGYKAAQDTGSYIGEEAMELISMRGPGGSNGVQNIITSDRLYANLTEELAINGHPPRFAAKIDNDWYMPMWPSTGLFNLYLGYNTTEKAFGVTRSKNNTAVKFHYDCTVAQLRDNAFVNKTNAVVFFEQDNVGMSINVTFDGTTLVHKTVVQNFRVSPSEVQSCEFKFNLVKVDSEWESNSLGVHLNWVANPRALAGKWHEDASTTLTGLHLVYRNTWRWFLVEWLAFKDNRGPKSEAVLDRMAQVYAQTVIMRTSQEGSTIHDIYTDQSTSLATRYEYRRYKWFFIIPVVAVAVVLALAGFAAAIYKPIFTGDIMQTLATLQNGSELFMGYCAPQWRRGRRNKWMLDDVNLDNRLWLKAVLHDDHKLKVDGAVVTVTGAHLVLSEDIRTTTAIKRGGSELWAGASNK